MNIDRKHVLALGAAAVVLGGCATDPKTGEFVQYELGESVKQTMMAQVINPDPEYDTLVPESSGEQASDAIERYRNDAVKEPEGQEITVGSGGGGGGGSN